MIVGKVSPFIDVDHEDPITRKQNEIMLEQELSFAGHLSLPAVLMSLREKNVNLARILHNRVMASPLNQTRFHVWLHIPMVSHTDESLNFRKDATNGSEDIVQDTWKWWNNFRCVGNFEKKLGLALELSADLPEAAIINR